MGKNDAISSKKQRKKRIAFFALFTVFSLLLLLIELFNIRFSDDQTTHDIIYAIMTRAIGSFICILMMLYCSFGHIFSLRGKISLKKILIILPCWLVSINNFPFIAVFNGDVSLSYPLYMVALLALECLLVGFFEECAFRGCVFLLVLQGRRKNHKDIFMSIIISSVIFGVTHLVNIFAGAGVGAVIRQLGYSFLIGAMCSVVLIITKEIWSCILLHAVFNFAGAVYTTLGSGPIWNPPTVIITAVLAVIVTVYMVVRFFKVDISSLDELFEQ